MKDKEKHDFIIKKFKGFENKSAYVSDLWEHLEEGKGAGSKPFSMYRNWFQELFGSIPEKQLNDVFEFTKDYPSNADSEAEEKTEPNEIDGKAFSEREPHLT